MSEAWKKHDRPCPPCADCGAELYEKFWGNGGWAKTDKATDEGHGKRHCVRRLTSAMQSICDLASARLGELDAVRSEVDFANLEHDLKEIVRLTGKTWR